MNFDEALEYVRKSKPEALYLGGKTSTGKSTFARQLGAELDYKTIELDEIVREMVVKARGLANEGEVFSEVYKQRNHLDWIGDFEDAVKREIDKVRAEHHRVILDGAIVHPVTLSETLSSISGVTFLYFHPEHLDVYERNLTNRFRLTSEKFRAGLPMQFWKLVDDDDFREFCKSRQMNEGLRSAIRDYARRSQKSSEERMKAQEGVIGQMLVVLI